mmetsp:Transcript_1670/g.4037  ORF Transcript_1670/g.4037 Transcript_1670/m.4037 type:complete len:98 (-) Transcript_1670:249-542(-)
MHSAIAVVDDEEGGNVSGSLGPEEALRVAAGSVELNLTRLGSIASLGLHLEMDVACKARRSSNRLAMYLDDLADVAWHGWRRPRDDCLDVANIVAEE